MLFLALHSKSVFGPFVAKAPVCFDETGKSEVDHLLVTSKVGLC